MLARGEFVHANCLWTDGRFFAYRLVDDAVALLPDVVLDLQDLCDADCRFSQAAGSATYGGGDSTAHGSCGFFFKRGERGIAWALFSLESDPFVGVEVTASGARFRSQCGDTWVVVGDDITQARMERRGQARAG